MASKFVIVFISLLLVSCSQVTLSSQGCATLGKWYDGNRKSFRIEEAYGHWGISDHEIRLNEIFLENGMRCKNVGKVHVTFKKSKSDFLLSLIPFYSRTTLIITGKERRL